MFPTLQCAWCSSETEESPAWFWLRPLRHQRNCPGGSCNIRQSDIWQTCLCLSEESLLNWTLPLQWIFHFSAQLCENFKRIYLLVFSTFQLESVQRRIVGSMGLRAYIKSQTYAILWFKQGSISTIFVSVFLSDTRNFLPCAFSWPSFQIQIL